jgi:hypothetical protein
VAVIQFDNSDKKVYFWHTIGSTYTCSSIDTTSLETSKEWYWVTDVFSWWTPFLKEINNIRIATSYTAEDNYIKLYYRINNWVWEELRNINEENDTIVYEQLSKLENQDAFKQFVDIQFKVEFHNETQDDTPPLLHELRIDYDVIEANGW